MLAALLPPKKRRKCYWQTTRKNWKLFFVSPLLKNILEAKKRWKVYGKVRFSQEKFCFMFVFSIAKSFFPAFSSHIFTRPPQSSSFFKYFHTLRECMRVSLNVVIEERTTSFSSYFSISMITSITVNVVKSSSFTLSLEWSFSDLFFFFWRKKFPWCLWRKKIREEKVKKVWITWYLSLV